MTTTQAVSIQPASVRPILVVGSTRSCSVTSFAPRASPALASSANGVASAFVSRGLSSDEFRPRETTTLCVGATCPVFGASRSWSAPERNLRRTMFVAPRKVRWGVSRPSESSSCDRLCDEKRVRLLSFVCVASFLLTRFSSMASCARLTTKSLRCLRSYAMNGFKMNPMSGE